MRKFLSFTCKFIASGILATVILSAFSVIYYNPATSTAQPGKYTNFTHKPNTFWSCMTEGFGFGLTNNLGYNSRDDIDPAKPMIAVLGSSHMEGKELPQSKNAVSLLQNMLFEDSNDKNNIPCLNLGMAGHYFEISVSNFEYLTESLPNSQYVIIETNNLSFSGTQLEKMYNGEYHSDFKEQGTLYKLSQSIPYLRLLYKQYQNLNGGEEKSSAKAEIDYADYEEGMNAVLGKISEISEKKGIKTAILYHTSVSVKGGIAFRDDDLQILETFKKCCEKNNIDFIDATDSFVDHFNETYELPYGFMNTTPGTGHLNKVGHALVAEELYEYISKTMEEI